MKQIWKLLTLLLATILLAIPVFAQEEEEFSILSMVLDFIMIIIGIISVYYAWSVLQGKIGQGLRISAIGLAIFGLFHLLETLLFLFTNISVDTNEIFHRIFGIVAFTFIAFGLYKIKSAVREIDSYYQNRDKEKLKMR